MSSPATKRQKVSLSQQQPNEAHCKTLLESWLGVGGSATAPPSALQELLGRGVKIRQDLHQLQKLFDRAGFRTSIVQSPRLAMSLYKESCVLMPTQPEQSTSRHEHQQIIQRDYLLVMLGIHPDQEQREECYRQQFREQYCIQRFLVRLQSACPKAMNDPDVKSWVEDKKRNGQLSDKSITTLMKQMQQADHRLRQEQLDHELERIRWSHCTLANALLQQFLATYHGCIIKDVFFKTSHVAKYERLTFYLYDPNIDIVQPANFVFLPDLTRALQTQQETSQQSTQSIKKDGTHVIVQDMLNTFWLHMLCHGGYHASSAMKRQISPALERFFLSGLQQDFNIPLKL